eukprot:TRINITY_DN20161_c0_g1_i3.p1 TRINITY_DN20161_c0_g1~~TRINITY_DN20161_c0_g1_i3.p1  ORF type:complete len:428 (+),score=90.21 TRINITY_DN20161_c0_g1_i3:176-1459(+)
MCIRDRYQRRVRGMTAVQWLLLPLLASTHTVTQATVYHDERTQQTSIHLGVHDVAHGTAVLSYEGQRDGWGKLHAAVTPSHARTQTGAFSMGYGEGYLTCDKIDAIFVNAYADWFKDDPGLQKPLYTWLNSNMEWMRQQVRGETGSPFWSHAGLFLAQLDGLYAGYSSASVHKPGPRLTMQDLVLLNADGDVESLAVALGLGNATRRKRNLRCSALFKLLPNNSDLVFGHTTWDHFTMMGPRMLKSYDYGNPGGKVTMSSSPAFLSSIDDFYLTSNQLAVIETTNGNFNDRLWDVLSTRSALSWLRVSVANLLAESIHEWGALFAVNNSGTYCDQWMVFDMKKFAPGRALLPGSFLVLEQLPGHIHSQDMSAKLQRDSFWAVSYTHLRAHETPEHLVCRLLLEKKKLLLLLHFLLFYPSFISYSPPL